MIKPFISPKELKAFIEAGQNWVNISKSIWLELDITNVQESGFDDIQLVGWLQGEESPLDLGIDMPGVVIVPCTARKEVIPSQDADGESTTALRYDPCYVMTTCFGLITSNCARSPNYFTSASEKNNAESFPSCEAN
jgi:hypothetical protein